MLKVTYAGCLLVLDTLMVAYDGLLTMHLFKSDTIPLDTTVLGDLTEANYDGYASQVVGTFGAATLVGIRAVAQAAALTFTKGVGGTPNQIYGYYIRDNLARLVYLERDPASPIPMTNVGDSYVITPTFSQRSEY